MTLCGAALKSRICRFKCSIQAVSVLSVARCYVQYATQFTPPFQRRTSQLNQEISIVLGRGATASLYEQAHQNKMFRFGLSSGIRTSPASVLTNSLNSLSLKTLGSSSNVTAISPTLWAVRTFHSTPTTQVRQKYLRRLKRLRKHYASQMLKPKETKTDPVLGRKDVAFLDRARARVSEQYNQIDLLDSAQTDKLLFGAQQAAVEKSMRKLGTSSASSTSSSSPGGESLSFLDGILQESQYRKEVLLRIVSMQNAKPGQAKKLATSYAVQEFGRTPGDTGSSEVQAAVWTMKINYLATHLKENKQDVKGLRRLEQMVHNRQGILKYLKRTDPQRYFWAIEKLGLSDDAVSNEFHLSRQYLWDTQFFGDKTLPMKKTRKDTRAQRKKLRMEKKVSRTL